MCVRKDLLEGLLVRFSLFTVAVVGKCFSITYQFPLTSSLVKFSCNGILKNESWSMVCSFELVFGGIRTKLCCLHLFFLNTEN
jgi:hypothetical protein